MAATSKQSQLNEQLRDVGSLVNEREQQAEAFNTFAARTDSTTRQTIAKYFVFTYFALLALIIVGVPVYDLVAYHATHNTKALQLSLADSIQTYSAVAGPTLGFVVAYYFKSKNEN